jgi:uncharacterized membrane protein YjgN (DUF898 family)
VSASAREHLKKGSGWMKALAILGFVGLGIIALALLIVLAAGSSGAFEDGFRRARLGAKEREVAELMFGYMKWMVIPGIFIIAGMIFANVLLLKSSNGFSKIGIGTDDRFTLVETFTNYRKFWMTQGIILISVIAIGLLFIIMIMPKLIEIAR